MLTGRAQCKKKKKNVEDLGKKWMYFNVLLLCLSLTICHLSALPFLLGKASKPYGEAKHRSAPNPESKARSQEQGAGMLSS